MTDFVSLNLEIKICTECPNIRSNRVYTGDSFENLRMYICRAAGGREIGTLDTFEKLEKIPQWCPLR
jgi:hypothetical protein